MHVALNVQVQDEHGRAQVENDAEATPAVQAEGPVHRHVPAEQVEPASKD